MERQCCCERQMGEHFDLKDNSSNGKKESVWSYEDVEALRNLVKNEKNLKARTDDLFLLGCLRARKFDRQKAFKLLKNYYTVRKKYPDIYTNFSPSSMENCLQAGMMGYLSHTDHEGRGIAIGRATHWDPSLVHAQEVLRGIFLIGDFVLNNHLVQINGGIIIIDVATASFAHALQITPILAYRVVTVMLGAYPLRYKAIHLLNMTTLARGIMALFLPFAPIKIKKRIHIHPNLESLHKFVHPKFLPSDFGGELPPFDPSTSIEELRRHEQFFRENEKYWTVENNS